MRLIVLAVNPPDLAERYGAMRAGPPDEAFRRPARHRRNGLDQNTYDRLADDLTRGLNSPPTHPRFPPPNPPPNPRRTPAPPSHSNDHRRNPRCTPDKSGRSTTSSGSNTNTRIEQTDRTRQPVTEARTMNFDEHSDSGTRPSPPTPGRPALQQPRPQTRPARRPPSDPPSMRRAPRVSRWPRGYFGQGADVLDSGLLAVSVRMSRLPASDLQQMAFLAHKPRSRSMREAK